VSAGWTARKIGWYWRAVGPERETQAEALEDAPRDGVPYDPEARHAAAVELERKMGLRTADPAPVPGADEVLARWYAGTGQTSELVAFIERQRRNDATSVPLGEPLRFSAPAGTFEDVEEEQRRPEAAPCPHPALRDYGGFVGCVDCGKSVMAEERRSGEPQPCACIESLPDHFKVCEPCQDLGYSRAAKQRRERAPVHESDVDNRTEAALAKETDNACADCGGKGKFRYGTTWRTCITCMARDADRPCAAHDPAVGGDPVFDYECNRAEGHSGPHSYTHDGRQIAAWSNDRPGGGVRATRVADSSRAASMPLDEVQEVIDFERKAERARTIEECARLFEAPFAWKCLDHGGEEAKTAAHAIRALLFTSHGGPK
jgi:hypothetical protein